MLRGGGGAGRGGKTGRGTELIRHAKGPELVLSTLAALSDTESLELEQEPDSPVAASLPDKSRESDRLGKSKSD